MLGFSKNPKCNYFSNFREKPKFMFLKLGFSSPKTKNLRSYRGFLLLGFPNIMFFLAKESFVSLHLKKFVRAATPVEAALHPRWNPNQTIILRVLSSMHSRDDETLPLDLTISSWTEINPDRGNSQNMTT